MTTGITFSRQHEAGSRARTARYWETPALVVVLVLEKTFSWFLIFNFWHGQVTENPSTPLESAP